MVISGRVYRKDGQTPEPNTLKDGVAWERVTRDGVLSLDKTMLASWRAEVERVWFE